MKDHKVNISSRSIEVAGLPLDKKYAIAEYIWNGFDANASEVIIEYEVNNRGQITEFSIFDNGTGIDHDRLKFTFGAFFDSPKRNHSPRTSCVRGQNGKGRFSFTVFADNARWQSWYQKGGKNYSFDLFIEKGSTEKFATANHFIKQENKSGTKVTFFGLNGITNVFFSSEEFEDFLSQEFGWYLYLNSQSEFAVRINDKTLSYKKLIDFSRRKKISFKAENGDAIMFKTTFIRWKKNISDKCYYYYLNRQKLEIAKELTLLDDNPVDFHHSVFVESDYFDDFVLKDTDISKSLFGKNNRDRIYKQLVKSLNSTVSKYMTEFIRDAKSENLITKFEQEGYFDSLPQSTNGKSSEKLKKLVKEIYCIEPRLFERLKKEQAKFFTSSLCLIIDLAPKENIISLIDEIIPLAVKHKKRIRAVL